MKPDTFTRTPEDAAAYEQIRATDEHIADRTFVEVRRYCFVCQNATRTRFVCGPCRRVIESGIDQAGGYTDDQRDRMRAVVELDREEFDRADERNRKWWA